MDAPLISVIIPVYKVEKYLKRCLKSVRDQSYRNLEVIVVDDGSPDGCPAICDSFATSDNAPPPPRFIIKHQKNGGVDVARNAGLDAATGKYICFVDSDDWLPRRSIETLYNRMLETDADAVFGNAKAVLISGACKHPTYPDAVVDISDKEALEAWMSGTFAVWGALYKREVFEKNRLRFPLDMALFDDCYFISIFLRHCRKVASTAQYVYYYNHINDTSLTRTPRADSGLCYVRAEEQRMKLFEGSPLPVGEYRQMLEIFKVSLATYVGGAGWSKEEKIRLLGETIEYYRELYAKIPRDLRKIYPDDEHVRFYFDNERAIVSADYGTVYNVLREEHERNTKKRGFKSFVRKVLLKPEQFVVFKLGWFYKK